MFYQFCLTIFNLLVNNAEGAETQNKVLDPTYQALDIILPVALGIVLLCGTLYSIVLGVQYSRAESTDERSKVKKRLVNAIIGFGVVLVLVAVLYGIRKPLGDFISGN